MSETKSLTFDYIGIVRDLPTFPVNLEFQPDAAVLKSFVLTNWSASANLYYLWCSLTQNHIGVIYILDDAIFVEPLTTFQISSWPNDVTFRLEWKFGDVWGVSGINAFLSITLEFSKNKPVDYFIHQIK